MIGKGNKGGIIGYVGGTNWNNTSITNISNCYNISNIKENAGGIVGLQGTTAKGNYLYVTNSYNIGNILGKITTTTRTETKTEFLNVYYSLEPAIGTGSLTSGEATLKTETEIKSQAFVDLLNSYQDDTGVYPTDWKKWKLGSDGYPTFVD